MPPVGFEPANLGFEAQEHLRNRIHKENCRKHQVDVEENGLKIKRIGINHFADKVGTLFSRLRLFLGGC